MALFQMLAITRLDYGQTLCNSGLVPLSVPAAGKTDGATNSPAPEMNMARNRGDTFPPPQKGD
jgi:hypothetical protein